MTFIKLSEAGIAHDHRWIRLGLLVGIVGVIGYVGYGVIRYPAMLTMYPSESVLYLVIVGCLLVGYGWMALHRTHTQSASETSALRQGIWWGLAVGILWIIEIWAGNLANPQSASAESLIHLIYGGCILAVPVVTLFAAARASRQTRKFSTGVWVGLWSGIVSALIVFATFVFIGFAFPNLPDPQTVSQFTRRGFTDYGAFSFSDSLATIINHLWIGPVLGLIFGAAGGVMGQGFMSRTASLHQD